MLPKPVVIGLSKNGKRSIKRTLVKTLPMAIKIPAIGKIRTGTNMAFENFCIASIIFSFIDDTPLLFYR